MHVIIFYACVLSRFPLWEKKALSGGCNQGKKLKKKTKPMCTDEESYRKKKTKPLVMPAEKDKNINNTKLHTLSGKAWSCSLRFFWLFRQKQQWRKEVEAFLYLVEVLEAFISQRYGNGEDWVGGVLVEAGFAVSSEQSQRPASADMHGWLWKGCINRAREQTPLHVLWQYTQLRRTLRGCKHSYKRNKWRNE